MLIIYIKPVWSVCMGEVKLLFILSVFRPYARQDNQSVFVGLMEFQILIDDVKGLFIIKFSE